MSARERNFWIVPSIWDQPWSEDARTLAFYLLTCRHRVTEGLYKLPKSYACEDLNWTPRRLTAAFAELLADGFIEYDDDAKVVLLVGALEIQAPANPNVDRAAIKALASIPPTVLFTRFHALAERHCKRFAEALAEAYPDRLGKSPSPTPSQTPRPPQPPASGGSKESGRPSRADGTNPRALAVVAKSQAPGGAAWAAEHFPDGDPDVVRMLADLVAASRREVTPEAVRARAGRNPIYLAGLGVEASAA